MRIQKRILVAVTFALVLAASGAVPVSAQWSDDPAVNLAVADRTSEQVIPKIAATPDGGCYTGWFDLAAGSYDVYLQRLDASGVEQWPHNGLLISDNPQNTWLVDWDLIADGDGNAVLVFTDLRDGGDLDVFAYRIDPEGGFLWGTDGVQLSANADFEPAPVVCETTDGDFVFVWSRLPDAGDGGLVMQRLTAAGAPLLAEGGLTVVSVAGEDPANPQIVPSAGGDVIVTWVRDIGTFLSPRHVRAQRFDATGSGIWDDPVAVFDATSVPIAYTPKLMADGGGGAVLWWHASPASLFNSHVQHLDGAGTELFPHNGIVVSTTPNMHHIDPALAFLIDTGECIVFWNERNSSQSQRGIFAQKITAAGTRAWGDGGRQLMPVDAVIESFPRCARQGDGAAVFFTNGDFGNDVLRGIGLDGNGVSIWETSPVPVATAVSSKSRYPLAVNGNGMVMLVWEDDRDGTVDLFAQNVNTDGSLGSEVTGTDDAMPAAYARGLTSHPNPFNPRTTVAFELAQAGPIKLSVHDLAGRRLAVLRSGHHAAGRHEVVWEGRDARGAVVAAGTYLLRLQTTGGTAMHKVTLLP